MDDGSRDSKMGGEQDEVQGLAAPPVVLPGLREAMPR
jgi:hypothetical protein